MTDCGSICVDLMNDPANCGFCGTVCPAGGWCQSGQCFACIGNAVNCGGVCADLMSDTANCGACGNICPAGVCQGGVCVAPAGCPPGYTECSGACVDLANDGANCGACGNACPGGACLGGVCATPATPCFPPLAICNGVCVDLLNDPANCGACGFGCGAGACQGGVCTIETPPCATGLSHCGWLCVDVQADPFNCGSCEFVCLPGQVCEAGICVAPASPAQLCAPPMTMCGGACVDLASNRHHCGACGAVCPHEQTCVGGQCTGVAAPATMTPVPVPKTPAPPADKWDLWSAGVTQLRGAHIYQRWVDPAYDEPDALGSGPFGPIYRQDDFDALAALGANYVEISASRTRHGGAAVRPGRGGPGQPRPPARDGGQGQPLRRDRVPHWSGPQRARLLPPGTSPLACPAPDRSRLWGHAGRHRRPGLARRADPGRLGQDVVRDRPALPQTTRSSPATT